MLKKILLSIVLLLSLSHLTKAQTQKDSLKEYQIDSLVITATRTEHKAGDSPIPVYLISKDEIRTSGRVKLDEILKEQTGINITNFLGAGVMMQGLDPAYSLILIDGEPLVGRNGGTIDLTRISLGNVKQIEIVKGPSSSLYGSEALAGVINIITESPKRKFSSNLNARIGTFYTSQLNGDINVVSDKFSLYAFADYNHSNGYSLYSSVSMTGPKYNNYSLSPTLKYKFNDKVSLELNSRLFNEKTSNTAQVSTGTGLSNYDEKTTLDDYNNSLILNLRSSDKLRMQAKFYNTFYKYSDKLLTQTSGELFDEDKFQETYTKGELFFEGKYLKNNKTILGGGLLVDNVTADRIYEGSKSATNKFAYLQDEFTPLYNLNITAGARFDQNSDYASRVSPKFSVLYRPFSFLTVKSSVGTGFKAPSFQQLYLDFTNPQVGYSVFGTVGFADSFQKLVANGEIDHILIDPSTIQQINPENSQAFNVDVSISPISQVTLEANFFRNDIKDMIEFLPVAVKTNGQPIYTYFNLSRIYTEGVEANIEIELIKNLSVSFGYQYLEAKDKDVIEQIKKGLIFKTGSTGVVRPVQLVEYGGLFNRAAQSGIAKINYKLEKLETDITLRTIIKGKAGYIDRNGNGILDNDNEYSPGYLLWNTSVNHQLLRNVSIIIGVDNIFDYKNPDISPELPGRIIYTSFNYKF